MKKLLFIGVVFTLLLTSCSSPKTSIICKQEMTTGGDSKDIVTASYEIVYDKDIVKESIIRVESTYEKNKTKKEQLKSNAEENLKKTKGIEGITFEYKLTDTSFEYTTTSDFKKANMDDLIKYGISFPDVPSKGNKVKYKDLKSKIQTFGYTCGKEKK